MTALIPILLSLTFVADGLTLHEDARPLVSGPWGPGQAHVHIEARKDTIVGVGPDWSFEVVAKATRFSAGLCTENGKRAALPVRDGVILVDLATGEHELVEAPSLGAPTSLEECGFAWVDDEGTLHVHRRGEHAAVEGVLERAPDADELVEGVALFATRGHVFVNDALETMTRYDLTTGELVRANVGSDVMHGAARSRHGTRVWFVTRMGELFEWNTREERPELVAQTNLAASSGVIVWPRKGLAFTSVDGRINVFDGDTVESSQSMGADIIGQPLIADVTNEGQKQMIVRLKDATMGLVRMDGQIFRSDIHDASSPHSLLTQPRRRRTTRLYISRASRRAASVDFTRNSYTDIYTLGAVVAPHVQIQSEDLAVRSGAYVWEDAFEHIESGGEGIEVLDDRLGDPSTYSATAEHSVALTNGCSHAPARSPARGPLGLLAVSLCVGLCRRMRQ